MIIDVSKWNGTIDWKKVKADGVDTVFIRCGVSTEKKCQTDSKFKTYINGALAQGIKVGLYYYSFSKTEAGAKQEADYCRKICAPYKDQLTYPIYIDIEEESCVKYAKTVAQAFCDRMKAEGWEAGVYTTTSVFKNQLKNFKGYSKWVAYPSSKKPSGDYDLWQYSWKGKVDGISGDVDLDKWLKEIKDVLANPDDDAIAFLDTFKLNLFAHEVFVFTPKGDIRTLAQGATVLDLAYQLHTELGEHCIGANVNKHARALSYILQSGDQVEILTSKKQKPEPEWLEIAVTAKAKDSIKKYFKKYGVITESVNTNDDTKARIAKLYIKGEDSMGILMHILKIICDEQKINIRDLHVTSDGPFFHCEIELVIYKQKVVSQTCMKLRELPNVTAVNIVEIN